jgi:hypothetical protein
MTEADVESKLEAYATAFIRGYTEALDKNYAPAVQKIREMDLESSFFFLSMDESQAGILLSQYY